MSLFETITQTVTDWFGGGSPAQPQAQAPEAENPALAAARAALAGQLQVVGDEEAGLRAPNQVSPEEFERMAALYADIRGGRGNVTLDASGLQGKDQELFVQRTMADIAKMMGTESGRELLMALEEDVDPVTGKARAPVHIGFTSDPFGANLDDEKNLQGDPTGALRAEYKPGVTKDDGDIRTTSDTTLFHELVHAYHHQRGEELHGLVEPGDMSPKELNPAVRAEEYATVGIHGGGAFTENYYRSELARLGQDLGPRDHYGMDTQRTTVFDPWAN